MLDIMAKLHKTARQPLGGIFNRFAVDKGSSVFVTPTEVLKRMKKLREAGVGVSENVAKRLIESTGHSSSLGRILTGGKYIEPSPLAKAFKRFL